MPPRSSLPRLTDIIEAIELLSAEVDGVTPQALAEDRRKRWLVERGIEIISEASRHLSQELKARHPDIPWRKVAGIGNILRHDYEAIEPAILFSLIRHDLPLLYQVCRAEYKAAQAAED